MNLLGIFVTLIIFVGLIFTTYIIIYNKFQHYIIRINEAEGNINSNLRKKFDLLNRVINIINANADVNEKLFEDIIKLRSRKSTNFDLDRKLAEALVTFDVIKDKHTELKKSSAFVKISYSLDETEELLEAGKKYYNDTISGYNELIKKFPSNIVAKLCDYKEKTFFDGIDMNDEIYDDFKL